MTVTIGGIGQAPRGSGLSRPSFLFKNIDNSFSVSPTSNQLSMFLADATMVPISDYIRLIKIYGMGDFLLDNVKRFW